MNPLDDTCTPIRYSKSLSKRYKAHIWLKLEMFNTTGSHKDRESRAIVKECLKKGFRKLGCATTGNYGISLAYYSKLYGLEFYVWVMPDTSKKILKLLKAYGAKVYFVDKPFASLVEESSKALFKMKVYNANPGKSKLKLKAHKSISSELEQQVKKLSRVICPINNGSLLLGLDQALDPFITLEGVISNAKSACSIKGFNCAEGRDKIVNAIKQRDGNLIKISHNEITLAREYLRKENLKVESSSSVVIAALDKLELNKEEHICCIITVSDPKPFELLHSI